MSFAPFDLGTLNIRDQGERHGQFIIAGGILAGTRTAAASRRGSRRAGWETSCTKQDRDEGHLLRASDRHPLGVPASRDWLLRHDLLASAEGLAGTRNLGPTAPLAVGRVTQGGEARPVAGGCGQHIFAGRRRRRVDRSEPRPTAENPAPNSICW